MQASRVAPIILPINGQWSIGIAKHQSIRKAVSSKKRLDKPFPIIVVDISDKELVAVVTLVVVIAVVLDKLKNCSIRLTIGIGKVLT